MPIRLKASAGAAARGAADAGRPRGGRAVLAGERGQLDELVAGDERGAAGEADVAAHADAVTLRDARADDGVRERLDLAPRGRLAGLARLECVERVPMDERGVQRGEDVGPAHVVEDRDRAADGSDRSDLAVVERDGVLEVAQLVAAPLVDVVHRAGG